MGVWYSEMGRVGHVGIVERVDGNYVEVIEANTDAQGSREGQGVWRKRRLLKMVKHFSRPT